MSRAEETEYGRCQATAKSTGNQCGRAAVGEHGKCDVHGGKTPTKDENPDVGAPEGSANAKSHGATADPWNLYENLGEEGTAWVDAKTDAFLDHNGMSRDHPLAERVELAVIMMYQERGARSELLKKDMKRTKVVGVAEGGMPITDEEAHYLNRVASSLNTDIRMTLKDTGHMDSPEDRQAEGMQDIASAWAGELDRGTTD